MIFLQKAGTCATTLFVPINSKKKKIPSVYTPYYSILVPYFNIRMVGRLWPTIVVTALITRLVAYPSLGVWKRQNKCLSGFNRCSGPHGSLWWLPGEFTLMENQRSATVEKTQEAKKSNRKGWKETDRGQDQLHSRTQVHKVTCVLIWRDGYKLSRRQRSEWVARWATRIVA